MRGLTPILMDFGLIDGASATDNPGYAQFEAARYAMGDTLRYALRINLAEMEPHGELTSTGYALAKAGHEYLVLQPSEGADSFTVELESGEYAMEWFSVNSRERHAGGNVSVDGAGTCVAPFTGPAVLYLKVVNGMANVIFDISLSLDGFINAANVRPEERLGDGGEQLHAWAFDGDDADRRILSDGIGGAR